jgi:hypothetical protein
MVLAARKASKTLPSAARSKLWRVTRRVESRLIAGILRVEPTEVNANRFARLAGGRMALGASE